MSSLEGKDVIEEAFEKKVRRYDEEIRNNEKHIETLKRKIEEVSVDDALKGEEEVPKNSIKNYEKDIERVKRNIEDLKREKERIQKMAKDE